MKTALLMGRQSLKQYHHWKGNVEAIEREYALNKQIGEELNCWKGGVLVADDDGKVLARIEELRKATSSAASSSDERAN